MPPRPCLVLSGSQRCRLKPTWARESAIRVASAGDDMLLVLVIGVSFDYPPLV
jgi:hypothetical protein